MLIHYKKNSEYHHCFFYFEQTKNRKQMPAVLV
nr:MAG TPA: hypothetical protein [Caudoviricetes sp.]